MTVKLFHQDVYLRECDSRVLDIQEHDDGQYIVLDQTIFSPIAGGQPGDQGTIEGCKVESVIEKDNLILHKVSSVPPTQSVHCTIDWKHRLDMMQNHCGEHILSGIFHKEYGATNKGFHMGKDAITMDIDIPHMSDTIVKHVETLANEAVYQNLPIHITLLDHKDDAKNHALRKPLNVSEDIKIVTIENTDCIACCGTHPAYTGEVGMIKIVKHENYKGMTRIYFKCGSRALADYQFKHEITAQLYKMHSANAANILEKIEKEEDKNKALKKELTGYKNRISQFEAESICSNQDDFIVCQYEDYGMDILQNIAKKTLESTSKILMLSSASQRIVLLTHNISDSNIQLGTFVKQYALPLGGKGGGSNTSAQVKFNDKISLDMFVEKVVDEMKAH